MTVAAIKLADLIGRGRNTDGEAPVSAAVEGLPPFVRAEKPIEPARPVKPAASGGASSRIAAADLSAGPREAGADPVVKDIESLAVKLFSLSRQQRGDPAQLMREALKSIEGCLATIKRQH